MGFVKFVIGIGIALLVFTKFNSCANNKDDFFNSLPKTVAYLDDEYTKTTYQWTAFEGEFYRVKYSYRVNGASYRGEGFVNVDPNEFRRGQIKVYYNPADPGESYTDKEDQFLTRLCGGILAVLIVFGTIGAIKDG